MAARTPYRLAFDKIVADRAIIQAVATLPDYSPQNQALNVDTLRQLEASLTAAQQAEDALLREATAAREQVKQAAWDLHEAVRAVKLSVEAQYGSDSPALHAVGLKRRSEYRRPVRRRKGQDER